MKAPVTLWLWPTTLAWCVNSLSERAKERGQVPPWMPSLGPSWLRLRGQSWARQEGAVGVSSPGGSAWLSCWSQPEKGFPKSCFNSVFLAGKHSIWKWTGLFFPQKTVVQGGRGDMGYLPFGEKTTTLSHKVSGSDSSLLREKHTSTSAELISAQREEISWKLGWVITSCLSRVV